MAFSSQYASPTCVVEIYPYFGGKYTFTQSTGKLMRVIANKNIRNSTGGHFQIIIAPGGPNGVSDKHTWTSILVPNSLAIIRMGRASNAETVMVGVVTSTKEVQKWRADTDAGRAIEINGQDFTRFFTNYSYFTLQGFGLVASNLFKNIGGLASLYGGQGIVNGTPAEAGKAWYERIMAGSQGILSALNFSIGNQRASYNNLVAYGFEEYPQTAGVKVPVALNFLNGESTWMQKFLSLYTFPLYEFFITTAPRYAPTSKTSSNSPYYSFVDYSGIKSLLTDVSGQYQPALPTLVARVNPLPYAKYDPLNQTWSWDSSRWDKLTTFKPDNGFVESTIQFDASEARNLYLFMPNFALSLLGGSTSNQVSAMENFGMMMDFSSLARFGYKPQIIETIWYSDPSGQAARQNAANNVTPNDMQQSSAEILSRIASYYEPTPSMLRGAVTINLRPDIIPGNKFQYNPYKTSDEDYLFYIEGVTHSWTFGGESLTTVEISRGLSVSEYSDKAKMIGLHTGQQHRIDGVIQEVPPFAVALNTGPGTVETLPGLSYFVHKTIGQDFLKDLPGIFQTPGKY